MNTIEFKLGQTQIIFPVIIFVIILMVIIYGYFGSLSFISFGMLLFFLII